MKYRDYEVEAILREPMPGYGRSVLMIVTAENRAAAEETARKEFTVLTGLPATLIKEIEAAPILTAEEMKRYAMAAADVLREAASSV